MSQVGGACAMPNQWWLDEAVLPGGLILGGVDGTFSEDQQEKFGVDAAGNVKDQATFQIAVEKVRGVRERVNTNKLKIYTVDDLRQDQWLPQPHAIIHLKGFGSGLNETCDRAVLRDISSSKCKMMVWDGDPFDETGFTKLVPKFLEANPQSKALAFKLDYEVDNFKERWEKVIEQFPDRIKLVAVDMKPPIWHDAAEHGITEELKIVQDLPEWAQEYFLLGRLACKLTGSKTVFSLGGGGISAYEAKAAASAGMKWTIYAMSRGRKEAHPTLADWAAENPGPGVSLRRNLDPDEENGFCKEENKKQKKWPMENTMACLLEQIAQVRRAKEAELAGMDRLHDEFRNLRQQRQHPQFAQMRDPVGVIHCKSDQYVVGPLVEPIAGLRDEPMATPMVTPPRLRHVGPLADPIAGFGAEPMATPMVTPPHLHYVGPLAEPIAGFGAEPMGKPMGTLTHLHQASSRDYIDPARGAACMAPSEPVAQAHGL